MAAALLDAPLAPLAPSSVPNDETAQGTPGGLVAEVQGSLEADPAHVRLTVDELPAERLLVTDGPHLRATDAGRALLDTVGAETAPFTARIRGGTPAEDLTAVGRVLALVTERADAILAALTA
ncbi:hypothetical protein [Streptomyces sp. CRN 30]|uniref:hypothetical protein n=1 Tax=Streptomyces sp. CRN 30 TaxID=3075613 RepID=UPI002A83B6CF|nr:hypothetical protein [Streptomyces sp. CRN 30]